MAIGLTQLPSARGEDFFEPERSQFPWSSEIIKRTIGRSHERVDAEAALEARAEEQAGLLGDEFMAGAGDAVYPEAMEDGPVFAKPKLHVHDPVQAAFASHYRQTAQVDTPSEETGKSYPIRVAYDRVGLGWRQPNMFGHSPVLGHEHSGSSRRRPDFRHEL